MNIKTIGTIILLVGLGIAYLVYLGAGCGALGGAMTWQGKVCIDDLMQ